MFVYLLNNDFRQRNKLGYKDEELRNFVSSEQARERELRQIERDAEKERRAENERERDLRVKELEEEKVRWAREQDERERERDEKERDRVQKLSEHAMALELEEARRKTSAAGVKPVQSKYRYLAE